MERHQIPGVLTGVGVGPGDPELMTLLAVRRLRQADCVAWMATAPGRSRARRTAAAHLPPTAELLEFVLPMNRDRRPALRVYDRAARQIGARLHRGADVACLCEGDPLLYGSFQNLLIRLQERHPVRVVPGVTAATAAAAAAALPLAAGDMRVGIVPAALGADALRRSVRESETVVFLKAGAHLGKLRGLLTELGCLQRAAFIADASLPGQFQCPLSQAPDSAGYFSLVILRRSPGAEAGSGAT